MTENICPKCGSVLNGFITTTIPPINGVVCPSCGWRHEKKEKIIRSVYQEPKPQTNADRIRAMTDEELATTMHDMTLIATEIGLSTEWWLQWLKSPVEADK